MRTKQISNPASLPVTIQHAKAFMKVDDNYSDAEILVLINAATDRAESIANRPFINRTYEATFDKFTPCMNLSVIQVQSVDSIEYFDTDNVEQTLATSVYDVDLGNKFRKCRIRLAYNQTYPSYYDRLNAVKVTFTAGYGADWNSVPDTIQLAILYLANHYFTNRNLIGDETMIPEAVHALLEGERVYSLS